MMASRGQKRTEAVDVLPPADKRVCNSFESRPSTSNSQVSSAHEGHEADMDALSYTSGSTRSEGDVERDSTYGSCESDYSLRDYYGHRASEDHSRFQKVLSSLSGTDDESEQLALLTELCELLSFSSDSSLSSQTADSFAPILVKLATHASIPDIMLLSIRAITYLCDANPRSSGFLVRHDAVPAICQRLMVIEYLDVAEQCLQALQKISHEQPLACLQSGAIMAVLTYIDFFATSVQRVALSTVVNICKKLSPESPSLFMDAVPTLCNLLQYEDKQLVESVVTCLIRIGEQVCHSPDMLDEICRQGLVQHALHLIGLNSRSTLSQPTYIGLIGLLVKLTSGSTLAFKTLFELNISNTVKDMLSSHHESHGTQAILMVDGHHGQVHEVLKLLNELLPKITAEEVGQPKSDKESYLLNHPDILQKFGVELLPTLIQVVNSGVNLFICYCALSVINKLVHFSKADALHSLLEATNFSSFLAGVLVKKDHHVILLALQIVDAIMLKLPHLFLNSFIKEGVLFSIHALVAPDNGLKLSPVFDDMRLENEGKPPSRDIYRCPCFAFDIGQSSKSSDNLTCKLHKEMVQDLASRIWTTHFEAESLNPEKGVTDALQGLRDLSSALITLVNKPLQDTSSSHEEEEINALLHQIMLKLDEKDSISTFEFVESGIIPALVNYLSYGSHLVGAENHILTEHLYTIEKRFEAFGRILLSSADQSWEEFPILSLSRRLHSALSSVENFPIISSHTSKLRTSYATVPFGHHTTYPCLRVNFVRENKEKSLSDYDEGVVHVDPFLPLDAIEGYLWPRVSNDQTNKLADHKDSKEKDVSCSHLATDSNGSHSKTADDMVVSTEALDMHKLKDPAEQVEPSPSEASDMITDHPEGKINEDAKPKLQFYLEGQKLDNQLTLYQSILEKQFEVEHYNTTSCSLWTHTYKITYRRHGGGRSNLAKQSDAEAQCSHLSKRYSFCQSTSFTPEVFVSEAYLKKLGSVCDILFLLKSLEEINRSRLHLVSRERTYAFAEGRTDDLDKLNVPIHEVSQTEFVNTKLTEKLEQQLRDPMTVSVGGMPAWCTQLMAWCPFLFGFEARYKFFYLAALSRLPHQTHTLTRPTGGGSSARQQYQGNSPRRKFLVHRDRILESAAKMMEVHASEKVLEVEYSEEVGTGLGPTLEFYTLVCREFQICSLGMWRENHDLQAESSGYVASPFGLFPRPWSPSSTAAHSEVIEKFGLLGKIVAKALQDGRILDLPFSKAFYKLILGKELSVFDIQSIDPAFGRTLLEFQAIVERKKYLRSVCKEKSQDLDVCFRNSKIEDLCLDFTLPGYPDYVDVSACNSKMVNLDNLEDYVKLMVDGTINSGINKQVEAFKSGFDQVFPIKHLTVFTEEELERLMCGDHVQWNSDELVDHVKFDHGYTVSSPPIVNLLEIMQEFDREQQRAFLQFVTGAPRLPPGGLASLNPKLTIVRKHCGNLIDADLPSVMTCANYLKLPPYSSKQVMKEKLLYAITEGQGSFHLS